MPQDTAILGKRKERDVDEQKTPGSTLFVSNLPYSATSTDLQTLFSDFAPVRSAFVVLEENISKGVGYVSFAIKEDAKTTLETIERDGLEINGRKLRVQMADRKPKEKVTETKIKTERKAPAVSRPAHPRAPKDPNAIRTIVISGLPNSVDKKTLWKKVRKHDGAESADFVEGENGVAHVLFSSPSAASHAVEKLHAHIFKGSILSVTLKKRFENLSKAPVKTEGTSTVAAPSRASRLIVRNLPWNITEKDLRALFLPFGPIYSITIPTSEPSSEGSKAPAVKARAKGFAFVWFLSKKDAERAIEGVNGRAVEAGAIVAPTLNKKERQKLRRQLREKNKDVMDEDAESDSGDDSNDDDQDEATKKTTKARGAGPRVLAVDWALSKDKWEEAKAKTLEDQEESASESGGESNNKEGESDEDVESNRDEDGDGMDVDEDDDERSDAEEAVRPTLPQTDVGTTLFVRNVPFEATEDELRVLFRTFGPLRYSRITMDLETGRSRGTGFVCFWNKEDADKAIHQSELLSRETGVPTPKANPFSLPSLLTPDPSSSLAQSLVLHGRTLNVTRAVTRDTAVRLKDEGERQREKADKRNLYLLREGVIFPGTPAEATLSTSDLEKRNASFNARRALLRSNPLLYVSKTRLSIRQLPLFVSDRALKRLGIHAVRAFEEEVKRGERQPLTEDEARREEEVHSEDEADTKKKKKTKGKKGERETGVKQAKIVRQADRVDALTGKGRSRGYGFLEMKRHSDALRVLRWANNNQTLGPILEGWWKSEIEELIGTLEKSESKTTAANEEGEDKEARMRRLKSELSRLKSGEGRKSGKTLIVEFSIENSQVVNRRKEKAETMKSVPKGARSNSVAGDDADDQPPEGTPTKRRKLERVKKTREEPKPDAEVGSSGDKSTKPGNPIGSIIGRKRHMRKVKTKA